MSAEKFRRSASRVLDSDAHLGALFRYLKWLVIELDTRYSTEIDKFLKQRKHFMMKK